MTFGRELNEFTDMKLEIPLDSMTVAEKIEAMETLWQDLSKNSPDEVIPAWHQEILDERAAEVANGTAEFLEWEDVKKNLRALCRENPGS